MTQVSLTHLTKTYQTQTQPILNDICLQVDEGELVALLGPSGAGKSTLLKLIAGIEMPDSGDIQFDGQSILGKPANKRGAVFMFQKPYLFPFLSIAENIGFGLKVQGATKSNIRVETTKMLDLIELQGFERKKPSQLSGGEQQRVALARALITKPKLLLLDEPLSNLDVEVRLSLQDNIRNIQRKLGITTMLVTHDLGEAMAMSDRMAVLVDGEIIAQGQPEALFHHPATITAAKFMGISTFLHGELSNGILSTPLGNMQIQNDNKHPRTTIFAIRPEFVRIHPQKIGNTTPAKIISYVFRGEFIDYQLALSDMSVRARVPMPAEILPAGTQVYVQFPPKHLFEISP
jgi:ABC-type Fe3+/spermidine/putrescine transport system ATPase subunit